MERLSTAQLPPIWNKSSDAETLRRLQVSLPQDYEQSYMYSKRERKKNGALFITCDEN
jgi:hypothetical protein